MSQKRCGLLERWDEQWNGQGKQKAGDSEMVQGIERKEKTIGVVRDGSYRYGERRKRWDQQYGVYEKRPMRGRALGTKRGRTLRERRESWSSGQIWEKRERERRRKQNLRTVRDVDAQKRRERQQKRLWNEYVSRCKERSMEKKRRPSFVVNLESREEFGSNGEKESFSEGSNLSLEEMGLYSKERTHRRKGVERLELNVRRSHRVKPINQGRVFGVHGELQKLKEVGGERVRGKEEKDQGV